MVRSGSIGEEEKDIDKKGELGKRYLVGYIIKFWHRLGLILWISCRTIPWVRFPVSVTSLKLPTVLTTPTPSCCTGGPPSSCVTRIKPSVKPTCTSFQGVSYSGTSRLFARWWVFPSSSSLRVPSSRNTGSVTVVVVPSVGVPVSRRFPTSSILRN